jgi:Tfp pilus assembly protein PilN
VKAVNLIPVEERRRGSGLDGGRSGGAVYALFGLIAGLAVLALLYGSASHQISNGKAEVASLQARTAQAQARAAALSPYTSFVAMREQREQAVQQLVDSRFDWARAFHELGRVLPADVSLTSLSGTIGSSSGTSGSSGSSSTTSAASKASAATGAAGASVSSATPPGSVPVFTLAGCTTSQANVAIVLDRLRLIDGVQEATLQSSTKAGPSGSGGAGASGGCEGNDAIFNMTVTFQALPTVPTSGSATGTTTVAATTSTAGASSGAPR